MAHIFDPEEFLEIARVLITDNNYPQSGRYRTSIGRAYYAVYLRAKTRLSGLGIHLIEKEKVHEELRKILRDKLGRWDLYDKFQQLFDLRIDADYFPEKRIDLDICNKSIGLAEVLMNLINNLG